MNTRWWESYLVRYFIGFIVGAGCVATIASHFVTDESLGKLVSISKDGKPDWSVIFWMLSLAGLGYCYVASTPITVLHAGRYGRGPVDSQSRYFWLSWILVLLTSSIPGFTSACFLYPIAGLLLCSALLMLLVRMGKLARSAVDVSDKKNVVVISTCLWFLMLLVITLSINHFLPIKSPSWVLPVLILGYPIVWIGFVQYAVLWRLLFEQEKVEDFYKKLFHARRQKNARDVRDTYTHLREHSNSVFSVLIEFWLLAFIFSLINIYSLTFGKLDLGNFFQILGIGVAIWVLPTVFMWSRANAMESSFSTDPIGFLGSSVDD
ncbi:MAG: hypothetical protein R3E56_11610 [Burkholderiaceae bacterium]